MESVLRDTKLKQAACRDVNFPIHRGNVVFILVWEEEKHVKQFGLANEIYGKGGCLKAAQKAACMGEVFIPPHVWRICSNLYWINGILWRSSLTPEHSTSWIRDCCIVFLSSFQTSTVISKESCISFSLKCFGPHLNYLAHQVLNTGYCFWVCRCCQNYLKASNCLTIISLQRKSVFILQCSSSGMF